MPTNDEQLENTEYEHNNNNIGLAAAAASQEHDYAIVCSQIQIPMYSIEI